MLHAVVVTALALIAVGEQKPPEAVPLPLIPPEPTAQALRLPGPKRTLTLADAVALALAKNPEIAQARAQLAQAAGATRTARGQELPRFTAIYSYQSNPEAGISGATITTNIPTREVDSARQTAEEQPQPPNLERFISKHVATLSLTQLLYDFGRTPAQTNAARRREDAARQRVLVQANAVAQNVRDRYYGLLQAEGLAGVRRADLASRRLSLENSRARFEAGAAPYGDLTRTTAAVAQAQSDLARALANAEAARVALNQALGLEPSEQTCVLPATEPEPPLPPLDRLLAFAYQRRPEMAQAEANVRAATADLHAARASRLPSFSFSLLATYRGANFPGDTSASGVGVTASWTPFDFGRTRGEIEQARSSIAEAEQAREQTRLAIGAAVTQAYQQIQLNEQLAANARVSATAARESLRVARARYLAGLSLLVDVTDAEAALLAAETDRVNAEYELSRARAALAYALGAANAGESVAP